MQQLKALGPQPNKAVGHSGQSSRKIPRFQARVPSKAEKGSGTFQGSGRFQGSK